MRIPKFRLEFDEDQIRQYHTYIEDILTASRPISNGHYVREFEKEFSAYQMLKRDVVAVGSGTDALELALRVSCQRRGRVVILPANTMVGTLVAVERVHAIPMLIDCGPDGSISPDALESYLTIISEREGNAFDYLGAVIMVHIGGRVSPYWKDISKLCADFNVPLIEDAAQCVGNIDAGFGDYTCFSLSATKVMTSGEGGFVTSQDQLTIDAMRYMRSFGSMPGDLHQHSVKGGNFKMTEFQAALGLTDIERIGKRIDRRREISRAYSTIFDVIDPESKIRLLAENPNYPYSNGYKSIVYVPDGNADEITKYCESKGVSLTGRVYENPLHKLHAYSELESPKLKYTDKWCNSHICPPNYPEMTDEEVEYVINVLQSFYLGEDYLEE